MQLTEDEIDQRAQDWALESMDLRRSLVENIHDMQGIIPGPTIVAASSASGQLPGFDSSARSVRQ